MTKKLKINPTRPEDIVRIMEAITISDTTGFDPVLRGEDFIDVELALAATLPARALVRDGDAIHSHVVAYAKFDGKKVSFGRSRIATSPGHDPHTGRKPLVMIVDCAYFVPNNALASLVQKIAKASYTTSFYEPYGYTENIIVLNKP